MDASSRPLVAAPERWQRWVALPLLGISLLLGWLTTPALLDPERMAMSVPLTVGVAVLRVVAELAPGLRVGSAAVLAGYALHLSILTAGVAFNPFLCIYAFLGYLDADRFLPLRLVLPAVVATGLVCGFGQSGGLPGVTATPALFVVLAAVNVTLALTMARFSAVREREVAERERAAAELARVHEENLALHAHLLRQAHEQGITEERARLSRELHDTVAQGLVGVIRQLENVTERVEPAVKERLRRAEEAARDCLTDARRAVAALAPHQLEDASLPEAVRGLVEAWSATHGITADVRVDGRPAPGASDDVVVRIVQEALANACRHAGATRVTVTLSWLADQLIVDVHDDGAGFEPGTVVRGRGLDGMAERLRSVGGRLEIESQPGEGTTVVAVVPR